MTKITIKDRKILFELWKNSRSSSQQIAKKVGLSREVIDYRIKRLVNEGIIERFVSVVDNEKLGFTTYMVNIQLQDFDEQKLQGVINYFKNHEFIKWVASCSGKWDIIIVLSAKDKFHLDTLFSDITKQLGNCLRDYEILTRLSIVKDSAISFISLGKENYSEKESNSGSGIAKLDTTDLALLSLLNDNARIMNTKIASSLKISAESARLRIKKLEKLKVIRGYRAMLDVSKLGYMLFMILIETNMTFYQKEKHLFTLFSSMPNIHYVERFLGSYPLAIEIVAKDTEEFQSVLIQLRNKLSSLIKSYELVVILKQHKQESFPSGMIGAFGANN